MPLSAPFDLSFRWSSRSRFDNPQYTFDELRLLSVHAVNVTRGWEWNSGLLKLTALYQRIGSVASE
jgi:hypothetical protein